jgi:outer membrane protein assembly factor BamB
MSSPALPSQEGFMHRPELTVVVVAFVTLSLGLAISVAAGDSTGWPRFRGPQGTGISSETGLLDSWPESGPPELWRAAIGIGYSGVTVAGDQVYTLEARDAGEYLICLALADGHELWRHQIGERYTSSYGDGPRSTPTIEGDRIYALGARGQLVALDLTTRKEIWRLDVAESFGFEMPHYWHGFCGSPVLEGDLLLLNVGGSEGRSIVALDKASGRVVWTAHTDSAAYSTPIAVEIDGQRQLVFVTAQYVVGLTPTGKELWKHPFGGSILKIAMPILVPPDRIFVSASYGIGGMLLQVVREGDGWMVREVWSSKVMSNHFHTSILLDEHLYGFDDGAFKCVEAATAKQLWSKRGLGKGSLILADGHFIVLSDRGKLVLMKPDPGGYNEVSAARVVESRAWTPLSLAGGRLIVRTQEEIVCFDLRERS